MNRLYFFLFITLSLVGCAKKEHLNEQRIEQMDYPVQWERFDRAFATLSPSNFEETQEKFPLLLHKDVPMQTWLNKSQDSLLRVVAKEVDSQFGEMTSDKEEINKVLKRIHYYFPTENPKKVITLISEVDINNQVVYTDSLVLLSLDTYLGKNHRFYSVFDSYRLRNFNPERIGVDLAMAMADKKVPLASNPTLLDEMIIAGKKLLVLDSLTPQAADTLKLNYTKKEWEWAKANEEQIWRYFIENKMLYDNHPKLIQRFISPAPFSKFYLSFDKESPGSIGKFIGYEIVKSFQDKHQLPLKQLLKTDLTKIFNESNYKPKK